MKIQIFKVEYIAWFNSYYFRKFLYKIKNKILTEVNGELSTVKLYKKRDTTYYKKFKKVSEVQYHPELIDIEIFNYSRNGWPADITIKNKLERK